MTPIPRTGHPPALFVHLPLYLLVCLLWPLPSLAKAEQSKGAIVYYSNETILETLQSDNYQKILHVLAQSTSKSASEIREAIVEDAQNSSQVAARDIMSLARVSRNLGVSFFVFSNSLAKTGKYLFFDPSSEGAISRPFSVEVLDENPLLKLSPLSRESYLRSALQAALRDLGQNSLQVILILNSHGSSGIPLMPRVNRDFTPLSNEQLLRALDDVAHDDLQLPDTVLQGTSQDALWRALGEVSLANNVTFPLVFLSSCESGPLSFSEVSSIPASVRLIVHSGVHGMSSQAINYEDIFASSSGGSFGIDEARTKLLLGLLGSGQGLNSDTRFTAWRWPVIALIEPIPSWALGVPLFIWMLWVISLFARSRVQALQNRSLDCGGKTERTHW